MLERPEKEPLHILFGTETGNSQRLAENLALDPCLKNFITKIKNLEEVKVCDLQAMQNIIVIISTWGDGAPPMTADDFCEDLKSTNSLDLSGLRYAVIALGDKNYPKFCQSGKQIDYDLKRLGAKAILKRKDLDIDYQKDFEKWKKQLQKFFLVSI